VHVPLLIVPADMQGAGTQRNDVVETRSVFSTVLDCLGIEFGRETRPKGLLPDSSRIASSESFFAAGEPEQAFSMVWLPDASLRGGKQFQIASLRTPRWKLIYNMTRDVRELYDLSADPGEKQDLSTRELAVFHGLSPKLDAWITAQRVHADDLPRPQVGSERADRTKSSSYL